MKKIVLMILCGLFFLTSQATQITISNDPNRPAQYSDLQTAIDDANEGDTLIIFTSATSYGNITVSKRLVLVGEGHFICSNPNASVIGTVSLQDGTFPATEPDSSIFVSLFFTGAITSFSANVDGIRFERCNFNSSNNSILPSGGGSINGWIVINNIFQFIDASSGTIYLVNLNNGTDHFFSNNLFILPNILSNGINYFLGFSNSSTNIFNNNIFIHLNTPSSLAKNFGSFTNGTFVNNIFYGLDLNNCLNCIYFANLTWLSFDNGDIPAANNLLDTDPKFVDLSNGSTPCNDFHLDIGSPALSAGANGDDLGIFGGNQTFEEILSGLPSSPIITNFFLNNPVLEKTIKLKFDVSVEKGKN